MKRPFNNPLIQFVLLLSDDDSGTSVSGKQSIVKKLVFLKERAKRFLSSRALCALILGIAAVGTFGITLPHSAMAGPDQVVVDGNVATAKGDQSLGIKVDDESVTTLEVNSLDPNIIQPSGTGVNGIDFVSSSGRDVTICSGENGTNVIITTDDDMAAGIVAGSQGTPPSPTNDPLLNIPIPGQPEVSGGVVRIESFSDITTTGNNAAHGIVARSNTTGYPQSVITALENFSDAGISFMVTSVLNPNGTEGTIGSEVTGTLLYNIDAVPCDIAEPDCTIDPDKVTPIVDETGGTFTLNGDGSFTFDPDDAFNDLAEGSSRAASMSYELQGTRGDISKPNVQGELVAIVTKTADGFDIAYQARFPEYGESTKPQTEGKALPDLDSYVAGLINKANDAGGSGNSVTVTHHAGDIKTSGSASHGIMAESRGKVGSNGRNGGGFWSFGTRKPTGGGAGNPGGPVTVSVDGTITIEYQTSLDNPENASVGVFAHSLGGNGGRGGNGGTYYYGRRGGTGGNGGTIHVSGNAIISTLGNYSSGILALSEGGDGGNGGHGADVTGGGAGGFGGMGGGITVDGSWDITTQGDSAHGIWAKSMGGNAGTGGSGGWLAGSPAPGGQATDGGDVTVNSGGTIETMGNDSYGIFGQSVGGFGGSGGSGGSIFYSRGGDGNSAGSGGMVKVTNTSDGIVTTHGDRAHAVYAQSVGGGGGSGGGAGAIVGVGGTGAAGGHGGDVEALNDGQIRTFGENARGIYAQSIGGGGGDGGDSGGLVAIGGAGSGTSDGGRVTVANTGTIVTEGRQSIAIFAESIGGGGGDGGSSSGLVSIGGDGGGGGDADNVIVDNSGQLETLRQDSSGIFAQSVGGGGGNGGGAYSSGGTVSVSIGGDGAEGGDAGDLVGVTSAGLIETGGDRSHGIFAQSVGGGGGNGGYAISMSQGSGLSLSVALGGDGGRGGAGKAVAIDSESRITTEGLDAHGIFAQSVGGGGGSGGFSIALAAGGFAGALAMGGQGEAGGDAGDVAVDSLGIIDTSGNHAYGILAQSVGGGGGDGGFSIAGAAGGGAVSLGFGGSGSGGGDGSTVLLTSGSSITTSGTDAHAMVAQSVGGGGGSGGFSAAGAVGGVGAGLSFGGSGAGGGEGGQVSLSSLGDTMVTLGDHSYGMLAQSVGGGGGDGGFSIGVGAGKFSGAFSMGGSGTGGGSGHEVNLYSESAVTTEGADAHGIFAQSVGGGGGSGGFSIAAAFSLEGGIAASLGGSGGGGGDGDVVYVGGDSAAGQQQYITGDIATFGNHAYGILAQSVGGGGGDGGFSIAGALSLSGPTAAFSLGGSGDGGGLGGGVELYSMNNVTTRGTDAHGVVVQSVGGGGGSGGFSVAGGASAGSVGIGASIGGVGAGGGNAGAIAADLQGNITTFGTHAYGVLAQSVGGGGGDGGFSIAGAISKGPAVTFSLGGGGGAGGTGGRVDVTSTGDIFTDGGGSYGIFAQSVGGGGGSGGFSIAGSFAADSGGLSASLGGSGDQGGDAGLVNVDQSGMITTRSNGSHGIFAQSVGGGGGAGGFSGAITGAFGDGASVALSIGGFGGEGGDGKLVSVDNSGDVSTFGEAAYGILAQSVGGGGGDGGDSVSVAIGKADKQVNLSVAVGGAGGPGGTGGSVDLKNEGLVQTAGSKAHGIYAQSVGGGGGNGGFSATGSLSAGTSSEQLAVSVGGFGGAGSNSGSVTVANSGDIMIHSEQSAGIYAQSVGGGGGDGGFSFAGAFAGPEAKNLSVAVGGGGGDGGYAGAVEVSNSGAIDTIQDFSHGIQAQSVGGGGGNGGTSVAIDFGVSTKSGANHNVAVSVGGSGGDGNTAGTVEVFNSNTITTRGISSHGIQAQSVGGGGGNGGFSLAGTISLEKKTGKEEAKQPVNISMAIGGGGGDGNDGGSVVVENSGIIDTSESGSCGIFAQSVGGGGGTGGGSRALTLDVNPDDWIPKLKKENINDFLSDLFSTWNLAIGGSGGGASDGGSVTVVNRGNIVTQGAESHGIFAQSVGGGGGLGGDASHGLPYVPTWLEPFLELTPLKGLEDMQIVVGGSGGSSGHGDNINVNNESNITTRGDGSSGIFVQSIGGGGGVGGSGAVGLVGNIGIGGAAGASGNGGEVTVSHDGQIETDGSASYGIFAQSIGGGGGLAGNVDKGLFDFGIGLSFARDGGAGGDGGHVAVTSNGTIMTSGEGATGIIAQSVGGGGGLVGDLGLGIGFVGSVGGQGSASTVDVTHIGDIITLGDGAHGIFAQSAGGKQSDDGTEYLGLGGMVNVTLDGNIIIQGADADGIIAQSIGMGGADDIHINVMSGIVQGGSGTGTGVRFLDGADNMLTNRGVITTMSGIEGYAVSGTGGNDSIDNYGTIIGSVDLGDGINALHNFSGAHLYSGPNISIGSGSLFFNAGTLSPGGSEAPQLTVLNSDLTQLSTGIFETNVYSTGDHDKLLVDNGSVSLDGTLSVIKGKGLYIDGTSYDLLEVIGTGNITGTFSDINLPAPTPLLSFEVSQQPNLIEAEAHAKNFTTVAMNRVEGAIAKHLDRIMPTVSGDLFNVMGVFQSLPASDLSAAFSSLSPGQYDNSTITTYNITRQYTKTLLKRMHSVRLTGETASTNPRISTFVSGGETLFLAYNGSDASISQLYQTGQQEQPTHGIWFDGFGQWGDQDEHDGFTGFDYNVYGATLGFDHIISDRYIVGISVGRSHTDIDVDKSQGDGDIETIYGSLYGSYYTEKMYVDAALSYGSQDYDNERCLVIGPLRREARSEHDGDVYTAFSEAGYNFDLNRWLLQPFASLQYIDLDEEGFTEKGADSLNQIIDGRETESLVSELGLRLAYIFQMDSASLISEVSAAWNYDFDIDDRVITTSFAGAPTSSFSIEGQDVEQSGVRIGASLTLMAKGGFTTSVRYSGEFREDCQAHGVIGELRFEF